MNDNYTLYDILRGLSAKRRIYVKYRLHLWHPKDKNIPKNEAELIKRMGLKSGNLDYYKAWENSEEFKHILVLLLHSKQALDLEEIYTKAKQRVMSDNATVKDVDMMIKLQTIIEQRHKQAQDYFSYVFEEYEDDE